MRSLLVLGACAAAAFGCSFAVVDDASALTVTVTETQVGEFEYHGKIAISGGSASDDVAVCYGFCFAATVHAPDASFSYPTRCEEGSCQPVCTEEPSALRCGGWSKLEVTANLGGGADSLSVDVNTSSAADLDVPGVANGGDGNDTISVLGGALWKISGGGDDDGLVVRDEYGQFNPVSHDTVDGGPGNDRLRADLDDHVIGGDGDDVVENSGESEEGSGQGGSASGGAGDDLFDTGGPDDSGLEVGLRLTEAGGVVARAPDEGTTLPDTISGFESLAVNHHEPSVLEGNSLANGLYGDSEPNEMIGNDGNDTLVGGGDADILRGGAGDDSIDALDGVADTVECGPGIDSDVRADPIDTLVDCETSVVAITSGPNATIKVAEATFTFVLTQPPGAGHYECRLDSGAFTECQSPKTYSGLADGQHTFEVRFKPDAGSAMAAASRTFTVDTTPPTAVIQSGPSGEGNPADAVITFTADGDTLGFVCSLDGAVEEACVSPVTIAGLADGPHVFTIRAVDTAGNAQQAPTERRWSVGGACVARGQARACVITPAPAGCPAGTVPEITFGVIVARAITTASCLVQVPMEGRSVYVALGPVSVNGMRLTPYPGSRVVADGALGGGTVRVVGRARLELGAQGIDVGDWFRFDALAATTAATNRLLDVVENEVVAAGLPCITIKVEFSDANGGSTTITPRLKLPEPISAVPVGEDGPSQAITVEVPITMSNDKGLTLGLRATLAEASLGSLKLKDLSLGYDHATGVLAGGGTVVLEPEDSPGARRPGAGRGQVEGGIEASFEIGPEPYLFGAGGRGIRKLRAVIIQIERYLAYGIFLQRAGLEATRGERDGVDTVYIGGLAGFSFGPRLKFGNFFEGEIVSFDGAFGVGIPKPSKPETFFVEATGAAKIVDVPVGDARLTYRPPTDLTLEGKIDLTLGVYGLRSEITDSWFSLYPNPGMNLYGRASLYLPGMDDDDEPIDAEAVVSSNGLAVCWSPPFFDTRIGIAALWYGPEGFLDLETFANGCELGPYSYPRAGASAAQYRLPQSFTVKRGERVLSLLVPGSGTPPKATLSGPAGTRITTPAGPEPHVGRDAIVVQDPAKRATHILVPDPRPGRWTITGAAGRVGVARSLAPVEVNARLGGRGDRRTLSWKASKLGGQSLQFVERGSRGSQIVATTRRRKGRATFTLLPSGDKRRTIEAVVLRRGIPGSRKVVARFRGQALQRPGRVRGLRLRGAKLSWRAQSGAAEYAIALQPSNGPTVTASSRLPRFAIPRALRRGRPLTILVTAVGPGRRPGPVAKLTVRR